MQINESESEGKSETRIMTNNMKVKCSGKKSINAKRSRPEHQADFKEVAVMKASCHSNFLWFKKPHLNTLQRCRGPASTYLLHLCVNKLSPHQEVAVEY